MATGCQQGTKVDDTGEPLKERAPKQRQHGNAANYQAGKGLVNRQSERKMKRLMEGVGLTHERETGVKLRGSQR